MMNGLDLFSGIGGISYALKDYVRPIAYCEIDPYCQAVLLDNMGRGTIERSPIWDDIRTLSGSQLPGKAIDIVYGGFPCQDISIAGHGKGLDGERSKLYWEIHRICEEVKPRFIFLENVPRITSLGGYAIVSSLAKIGYDSRWCVLSAQGCGAPHKRERWWLLAHASSERSWENVQAAHGDEGQNGKEDLQQPIGLCGGSIANSQYHGWTSTEIGGSAKESIRDSQEGQKTAQQFEGMDLRGDVAEEFTSNTKSQEERWSLREGSPQSSVRMDNQEIYWQEIEPPVCGVDDGFPNRLDRIRALGNAVVPQCAKKAFEILMGIKV